MQGVITDVVGHESVPDNHLGGRSDLDAPHLVLFLGILDTRNGGVAGGAAASKVRHLATYFHHRTPNGVSGAAVAYISPLESVFMHGEEQPNKVGPVNDLLG